MTLAVHIKATVKPGHMIGHITPTNKADHMILMAHIVALVTVLVPQTMQASHINIPGAVKVCHMTSHVTLDNMVRHILEEDVTRMAIGYGIDMVTGSSREGMTWHWHQDNDHHGTLHQGSRSHDSSSSHRGYGSGASGLSPLPLKITESMAKDQSQSHRHIIRNSKRNSHNWSHDSSRQSNDESTTTGNTNLHD